MFFKSFIAAFRGGLYRFDKSSSKMKRKMEVWPLLDRVLVQSLQWRGDIRGFNMIHVLGGLF